MEEISLQKDDAILRLRLPEWTGAFLVDRWEAYQEVEDRMRLAAALARKNIDTGTGGPFGAAVFDMRSSRLLSVGVNLVESSNCSVLHAEVVALILAQQRLGTYDLGAEGMPGCELVTSVEPCAMCLGAIPWSGIRRLVCGAPGKEAEAIGFDEGDKPADWAGSLERRGIEVIRGVLASEAGDVLKRYGSMGGKIYSPRSSMRK